MSLGLGTKHGTFKGTDQITSVLRVLIHVKTTGYFWVTRERQWVKSHDMVIGIRVYLQTVYFISHLIRYMCSHSALQVSLLVSDWCGGHFLTPSTHVVSIENVPSPSCAPLGVLVLEWGVVKHSDGRLLCWGSSKRQHHFKECMIQIVRWVYTGGFSCWSWNGKAVPIVKRRGSAVSQLAMLRS